jgi:hypothetical protein
MHAKAALLSDGSFQGLALKTFSFILPLSLSLESLLSLSLSLLLGVLEAPVRSSFGLLAGKGRPSLVSQKAAGRHLAATASNGWPRLAR